MKKTILSVFVVFFLVGLSPSYTYVTCAELDTKLTREASIFEKRAVVFSGNANPELARSVAEFLHVPLGQSKVSRFNDGEIQISIDQTVRKKDVFIVQSTCPTKDQSVSDTLMELYLMIRTMKRGGADSITAVIPYYGYARQDRQTTMRGPISAADVAYMLEMAGVDRVVTVDLHCGQIQGFFRNIPVENLYAGNLFADYFSKKGLRKIVVVSPDAGGVERANKFLEKLVANGVSAQTAAIIKHRKEAGVVDSMKLLGEVKDADAIIIDDMCDTGSTTVKAAQLLKDNGARRVFVAITHPVLSGNALDKIGSSPIDEMVITDTIPLRKEAPKSVQRISVAPLVGEAILRMYAQT
jgi:ribose-phosphate pyrophosphokinase